MKRKHGLSLLVMLIAVVCACMMFVVAGCSCSSCSKKKGSSAIKLSQTEISIVEGKSGTVVATYGGSEEIEWSIDKTDVASITPVKKVCTVKGLKVGTATLTAKAGNDTATCAVTVTEDNTEKVTITLNGEQVTEASVDMGETLNLVGTASQGSTLTWLSSNEKIATVENGVVSALRPGTVTITAQVNASIKAEVEVTVNSVGGYVYYELGFATEAQASQTPGVWKYWTEWGQFTELDYDNGTVNVAFSENGGQWANIQLFHFDSTVESNKYYKLSVDIDSSAAGRITVNNNVVVLQEGKHTYEVYFTNFPGFKMQLGVEGVGIDIFEGKVSVSNIQYEEDTNRVNLQTPSFEYDSETGVITITDPNAAGVKNYVLSLYQDEKLVAGVTLSGSGKVDWSKVLSGTYQAKIKAVAANVHYIDSLESDAQTIEVVNEEGIRYTFHNAPPEGSPDNTPMDTDNSQAINQPGIWTYWCSYWVTIDGEFKDNKLTVQFSNNTGLWHDTQLKYREPNLENGKIYILKLEINSSAGGRVLLNGSEFTIEQGTKEYDVVFVENGGLSIQFTFGLVGENNAQEIPAATMVFEIKGVEEGHSTQLQAPSATYDPQDGSIEISDPNEEGVGRYILGFFAEDGEGAPVKTIEIKNGDKINANDYVSKGKYALKIMAEGKNALYTDSDWSGIIATVESENESADLAYSTEDDFTSGWRVWYANWTQDIKFGECYMDGEGNIHLTYSGSYWEGPWGVQLFYKTDDPQNNKVTIHSSVTGNITVSGQKVELVEDQDTIVYIPASYSSAKGSHIDIQFGYGGINSMLADGGTFVISVDTYTPAQLSAPSFEYDKSSKVITILEVEAEKANVGSYELGFFESSEANDPVKTITVSNGDTVDPDEIIGEGSYVIRIKAIGVSALYAASEWSAKYEDVSSASNKTFIEEVAGEGAEDYTSGWGYYVNGPTVEGGACYIDGEGKIHLTYSGNTGEFWGMQLFFKTDEDESYSIKIKANVGGQMTVCGQIITLTADEEKTVLVPSNFRGDAGAKIVFMFGVYTGVKIEAGEFEITVDKLPRTQLTAPSFNISQDDKKITITDGVNSEGLAGYELGFFSENGDELVKTITVVDQQVIDPSVVSAGTYTVKIKAKTSDLLHYKDSEWSTYSEQIISSTQKTNIAQVVNEQAEFTGWGYFADGVTVADCYLDVEGKIHLTYSGSGPFYGMQLFLKESGAKNYNVKIHSSVSGNMEVSTHPVVLTAGQESSQAVAASDKSASGSNIVIMFGTYADGILPGGTFVITIEEND